MDYKKEGNKVRLQHMMHDLNLSHAADKIPLHTKIVLENLPQFPFFET